MGIIFLAAFIIPRLLQKAYIYVYIYILLHTYSEIYPKFKNISKSLIIQEIREILWENLENFLLTRFNLISMAK